MTVTFLRKLNSKSIAKSFSLPLVKLDKILRHLFLWIINLYRMALSPHLGGACRFSPSCSEYGVEAFRTHSFLKAIWLTFKRIMKCNPFGPFGFDPVNKNNSCEGN